MVHEEMVDILIAGRGDGSISAAGFEKVQLKPLDRKKLNGSDSIH